MPALEPPADMKHSSSELLEKLLDLGENHTGNSAGRECIVVEVIWASISDRKPYTTTVGITNTPRPPKWSAATPN